MIRFGFLLLSLSFLAGCAVPKPAEAPKALSFGMVLEAARRNVLDVRAAELFARMAKEHVEHSTLLRLPGIIDRVRAEGRHAISEVRRGFLDDAILYNRVLNRIGDEDQGTLVRAVARRRLDFEVASLLVRSLAAADKDDAAGSRMELRLLTGFDDAALERFDPGTLPEPAETLPPSGKLQQLAAYRRSESRLTDFAPGSAQKVELLFGNDPALDLLLSEALFRLPRRLALEEVSGAGSGKVARQASAVGIAFQIDADYDALRRVSSPAARRIAWFRLLTDLEAPLEGGIPEAPDFLGEAPLPEQLLLMLTPGSIGK